jgi:RNA polymerase sigma factor (sigma-70 family)
MQTQNSTSTTDIQHPEIADSILVQQALAGDQKAFEALVNRYQAPLFQLIYHYIREYHEAHDVLQHVWLQLYLSLATLRPTGHLKPWLFKVARNRCIDVLRRKRFLFFSEIVAEDDDDGESSLVPLPATSLTSEELAELDDLQLCIQRAIKLIPVQYQTVVWHYYVTDMSFPEIGRTLNIPASTAKARFQRAKPFLRAVLGAQLGISTTKVKDQ